LNITVYIRSKILSLISPLGVKDSTLVFGTNSEGSNPSGGTNKNTWKNIRNMLSRVLMRQDIVFSEEELKGNHDEEADSYDISVKSGYDRGDLIREKYFEVHEKVISLMKFKTGMKILDIGIGTGLLTEKLPHNVRIFGIDISKRMLAKVKEKHLNVELRLGSFLQIPFGKGFFDKIISTFAFHHVPYGKQHEVFNNMDDILTPGGSIIIGDLMFKNKNIKVRLRTKFKDLGSDALYLFDEEYPAFIDESTKYLMNLGYKISYSQISILSWVFMATKSI
jgi:putative AdoMet-dependent methyltransferase